METDALAGSPLELPDPSRRSYEQKNFLPNVELMRACYGGTMTMRQEAERFLPREISETDGRWNARRNSTTAFNKLKEAVDSASAKPFKNLVGVKNADAEFSEWMKDADLEGHHFHVVAHRFLNEAILISRAHILVDHPTTSHLPNLAAQRALKIRPFMRLIKEEDLLGAYHERVGGEKICVHARFAAERVRFNRDTFREEIIDQVYVIEQGVVQLWESPRHLIKDVEIPSMLMQGGSIQSIESLPLELSPIREGRVWKLVSEKLIDIPQVPLVSMRTGDTPLFQDLAYKQIEHFRSSSEQRNILAASRFPMLACSGVNLDYGDDPDGDPGFEIGPWKILVSPDANGRFYFVETDGEPLIAGQKDLEALEVQMEQLSLNPIINQPGRQYIAQNERSITEARVNTVIHDLALTAKDSLERAIDFMAMWSGRKPKTINVDMNFDFSGTDQLAKSITEIVGMMRDGSITPEGAIPELVRLNLLSGEFDVSAEVSRLNKRLEDERKADISSKANATRPDRQA